MPAGRVGDDITGQRFGRLVAIRPTERRQSRCVVWEFKCDCGNTCYKGVNNVRTGNSVGCGCVRAQLLFVRSRTHGLRNTRLWHVWASMKQRCLNPRDKRYVDYGQRGIMVCDRWIKSFADFASDMGPRPEDVTACGRSVWSIERIDNNKGYEPGNCKWATQKEQMANTRPRRTRITR